MEGGRREEGGREVGKGRHREGRKEEKKGGREGGREIGFAFQAPGRAGTSWKC